MSRITNAPLQDISPFLQGGVDFLYNIFYGDQLPTNLEFDDTIDPVTQTSTDTIKIVNSNQIRVKLPSSVDGCVIVLHVYTSPLAPVREVIITGQGGAAMVNNYLVDINLPQTNVAISIYGIIEDTRTLDVARVVDKLTRLTIANIKLWDPLRDIHTVNIENAVDLFDMQDPATYNNSLGEVNTTNPWNSAEVGKVWADGSTYSYLQYNDRTTYPNIQDRLRNWGRMTAESNPVVYKWVASELTPEQWNTISQQGQNELITGTARQSVFRKTRNVLTGTFTGASPASLEWTFVDTTVATGLPNADRTLSVDHNGVVYEVLLPGNLLATFDEIYHTIFNQLDAEIFTVELTPTQITITAVDNGNVSLNSNDPFFDAVGYQLFAEVPGNYARAGVLSDLADNQHIIFRTLPADVDTITPGLIYELTDGVSNTFFLNDETNTFQPVRFNGSFEYVAQFDEIQWEVDSTIRLFLLAGFDLISLVTPTVFLSSEWKNGDFVTIYHNGVALATPAEIVNNAIVIPLTLLETDTIEIVKFQYTPTEDDISASSDIDDGSLLEIWTTNHNFTLYNVPNGNTTVARYYFWVSGMTDRGTKNVNLVELSQQFSESDMPYMILQDLQPYRAEDWRYQQTPIVPMRYNAVTLRKVTSYITDNDRFILQFTRDNTLRYLPNGITGQLEKKDNHEEWVLFRQFQLSNVDRGLWNLMVESLIEHRLDNPTERVPSLELELYDEANGTGIRYGMQPGQTLVNKTLGLGTVKAFINDPNRDYFPIDIESFRLEYPLDTANNIEAAMTVIYDSFGAEMVNELWFELLMDALTTSPNLSDIIKTSWLALHGIRILDVAGFLDD